MSKEAPKDAKAETYAEVVDRLEAVVKKLESGQLSLEDSLKAFEEGIGLVKKGEGLLTAAEKRIEQLLDEDGELKETPFDPNAAEAPAPAPQRAAPRQPSAPPPSRDDEDVPF